MVTEDTIPSEVPQDCDKYLFDWAKNQESGASAQTRKILELEHKRKEGVSLDPTLMAG